MCIRDSCDSPQSLPEASIQPAYLKTQWSFAPTLQPWCAAGLCSSTAPVKNLHYHIKLVPPVSSFFLSDGCMFEGQQHTLTLIYNVTLCMIHLHTHAGFILKRCTSENVVSVFVAKDRRLKNVASENVASENVASKNVACPISSQLPYELWHWNLLC